jgi:hypothetical protein
LGGPSRRGRAHTAWTGQYSDTSRTRPTKPNANTREYGVCHASSAAMLRGDHAPGSTRISRQRSAVRRRPKWIQLQIGLRARAGLAAPARARPHPSCARRREIGWDERGGAKSRFNGSPILGYSRSSPIRVEMRTLENTDAMAAESRTGAMNGRRFTKHVRRLHATRTRHGGSYSRARRPRFPFICVLPGAGDPRITSHRPGDAVRAPLAEPNRDPRGVIGRRSPPEISHADARLFLDPSSSCGCVRRWYDLSARRLQRR